MADDPPPVSEPPGPEEQAPPRRVGEEAIRFSHSGQRYILGFGPDFFGIWDRNEPGGPLLRFPRNDAGWNEAWNRFSGMESRFIEVPQAGPSPDRTTRTTEGFRPPGGLGTWLVGLLAGCCVLLLVTVILRAVEIDKLHQYQRDVTFVGEAADASDAVTAVVGLMLPVLLAAGVVWLVWQHRGQANLRRLGADGLRFTPGWAVGWWLVPFAWFVKPFQTMTELWKASDPASGAVDWKGVRASRLLALWWTVIILRVILGGVATNRLNDARGNAGRVISGQWAGLAADVSLFIAGILAIILVRQIGSRQEQKRQRLAAYETAAAAVQG